MNLEFGYLLHHGAEYCQTWMPQTKHFGLYSALVCGQSVTDGSHRQLFIDTGLIHLLVVSGAHLHFMEGWLKWMPARGRLWLLGFYCWLSGFGAPVVRAWLRRLCELLCRRFGGSPLQIELVTLVLIVAVSPGWLWSRSFLMCWLCALAICLPPLFPRWPNLSLSLACYLLLFPFCPSAPSTILCNVVVTPVIGAVLFPLCALAALIPPLVVVTDEMWRVLLIVLEHFPVAPPAPFITFNSWLFLYPLSLHMLLLLMEVPWRRARAFASC